MKKLFLSHNSFGPKVNYRSWHKGAKVEEDMSFWGVARLFGLLLRGWKLVDYSPDGVLFQKN